MGVRSKSDPQFLLSYLEIANIDFRLANFPKRLHLI